MSTFMRKEWLPVAVSVMLGVSLASCGSSDEAALGTDTSKMNTVVEPAVDPLTETPVGLEIDAAAPPAAVAMDDVDGTVPPNDPKVTRALLRQLLGNQTMRAAPLKGIYMYPPDSTDGSGALNPAAGK